MIISIEQVDLEQINNIINNFINKNRIPKYHNDTNEQYELSRKKVKKIIQKENKKYKYQFNKLHIKSNKEFIYGIILFIDIVSKYDNKWILVKERNYSYPKIKEYYNYNYNNNIIASINKLRLNYLNVRYIQSYSDYNDEACYRYDIRYQNNLPILSMLFHYKNYTYDENKNKSLICFSEKEINRNIMYRKKLEKDINIIHNNKELFYSASTTHSKRTITKRIYDGFMLAYIIHMFVQSNNTGYDIKKFNNDVKYTANELCQSVITIPFDKNNQIYLPNITDIKTVKIKLPPFF